jgi:hypothetical protein
LGQEVLAEVVVGVSFGEGRGGTVSLMAVVVGGIAIAGGGAKSSGALPCFFF